MLGLRIREARLRAGLSQPELAERARVTQSFISMLEGGKRQRVGSDILARIADATGTTVEALLSEAPPRDLTEPPLELFRAARLPDGLITDLSAAWLTYTPARRLTIITQAERLKQAHEDAEGTILLGTLATTLH